MAKQTGQNQKVSPHTDAPVKPTTPPIQSQRTAAIPNTMPDPCPMGARRVWNQARPKKGIEAKSRIGNFNDGGEKTYNQKPHLAPGVPKNDGTTKGYFSADARPGKKTSRGSGGGTYDTEQSAGAGLGAGHSGYSAA